MSKRMKMILPLIDPEFELSDFSEKAGFVDVYDSDINKPYLDNHIFIMYDASVKTKEAHIRDVKFSKLKTLYNERVVYISGNPYLVYAFVITNSEVKRDQRLLSGDIGSPYNKLRIMQFWHGTDDDVNKKLTMNTMWQAVPRTSVPEEDYLPSLDEVFMCETTKGGTLR